VARPRFSIVIPAYNAARTIEATIRSVYLQTTGDLEVVVVDDGSTDDTAERVARVADERVTILRQENSGPSIARNTAIARLNGRYVCPLDADDLLLPEFLECLGAALDRNESAGFAYTDAWVLDDTTGRVRKALAMSYDRPPEEPPADPRAFLRLLIDRNFVYGCTVMRRDVLQSVGGYSSELRRSEDYELWLRMLAYGYSAVRVAGPLAVHRELETSNSTDLLATTRSAQRVFELVASYPIDDTLRSQAIAVGDRWRRLEQKLLNDAERTLRDRVLEAMRPVKRRVLNPWRWHRRQPREVRLLLDATGG
jgi:glycosyltransferase involved in cell wall biosynthesis